MTEIEKKLAQTVIWLTTPAVASDYLVKIHRAKIKIKAHIEHNLVVMEREFTPEEWTSIS